MIRKNSKKLTIYEDYINILSNTLNSKGKVKTRQNLKDAIIQQLRLVCDPKRTELKKQAKEHGVKNEQIHHKSGCFENTNQVAKLADSLIDGEITPQEAIEKALSCMEAVSDEEHANKHQKRLGKLEGQTYAFDHTR